MQLCGLFTPRRDARGRGRAPTYGTVPATTPPLVRSHSLRRAHSHRRSECGPGCKSVCAVHGRKSGDFLIQRRHTPAPPPSGSGTAPSRDFIRGGGGRAARARARSAPPRARSPQSWASGSGSHDSSALHMSSPSMRSPREGSFSRDRPHRRRYWAQFAAFGDRSGPRPAPRERSRSPSRSNGRSAPRAAPRARRMRAPEIAVARAGGRVVPPGGSADALARRGVPTVKHRQRFMKGPSNDRKPRYVVIDGMNLLMPRGLARLFDVARVEAAINFYKTRQVPVMAIFPMNSVDKGRVNYMGENRRLRVLALQKQGLVTFAPAGTDYRLFMIRYAEEHSGHVLSNRLFQDLFQTGNGLDSERYNTFRNNTLVPYAFVNGVFVPHPNPSNRHDYLHYPRTKVPTV